MRQTARSLLMVAAFLVLGAGAFAVFGANGQGAFVQTTSQGAYLPDSQTAAYRTSIGGADSTSIATLTSTTTGEFVLGGDSGCRSTVSVSGRFSTAGQTCVVKLIYLYRSSTSTSGAPTSILGSSTPITLTAGTLTDRTTSYFEAPTVYFDAEGATGLRVVVLTAPNTGTVDLWVGSF